MNEPDLATDKDAPASQPPAGVPTQGSVQEEAEAREAETPPKSRSKPKVNGDTKRDRSKQLDTPRRWSWPPGSKRDVPPARYDALAKRPSSLLCVDNISVSFDGFKALSNLTLILDDGELRCIIGPNGAGKTTLMDCITGKTRPDEGCVFLVGDTTDLCSLAEYEIAQRGIGRKFQRPTVFHGHSVFENLELALHANKGVFKSLFASLSGEQKTKIESALEIIGLKDRVHDRAGLLSHGQKQWLEIGMLLVQDPKVLLVDEPIAGMTHQEVERTAELLRSLAGKHTVVVVEHDMDFVRSIATRTVTVLHEGSVLAEGSMQDVQNDPKVVEVYLGE
ncbi:MAG TPA: urea ABC transporter ATP-binding protein UrtD [Polyangiaceae bacterium]